jgi:putative PIN family toxin of toxin-antitoxin system
MRIMFDTNIIISAGLFGSSRLAMLAEQISNKYSIVISSQIIDELFVVVDMKFPHKKAAFKRFLNKLNFEMAFTPKEINSDVYISIRDKKDYPILASAIVADVDVFITGDKDFSVLDIERPEILTISQFSEKYM